MHELKIPYEETITSTDRYEQIFQILNSNLSWKTEANREIKSHLQRMIQKEAADMDIGGPRTLGMIWFRIYADKIPQEDLPRYSQDETAAMLLSLVSEKQKKILFEERNLDLAVSVDLRDGTRPVRYRCDIFFERETLAANFRFIKQNLFPVEALDFPPPIIKRLDLMHEKQGLFLVTGITGSGKSATLDSIIDMNNLHNNAHIIIIGNPIEYIHESHKSIVTHREVGEDVRSFRKGVVEALRQDPDIIVVGEMRDAETIANVLEVTDSGHKVFTTLHTSSSVESIHRIVAEFPPSEQERIRYRLADVLKVCISQKLVPNKQGKRTLAKEILSVDDSVQAAIRNNNLSEIFPMITEGRKKGMYTMQQDLHRHVAQGNITAEMALNYCNNRRIMLQLLQQRL
jgi:twitching motility protein PilT